MMGKNYHKKTNRSRRKVQDLKGHAVTAELADGKACFQMVLPMNEMLFDVAQAIEQTAGKAGLNDDEGHDRRRGYPPTHEKRLAALRPEIFFLKKQARCGNMGNMM